MNEVNRPEELTGLVSDLLAREEDCGSSNDVALLLNGQDKAKVCLVDFTMNLYKQKFLNRYQME